MFPDKMVLMILKYLEKAMGFISNIQEYLQQEDTCPPSKTLYNVNPNNYKFLSSKT
jgi:hypothetical protein